VFVDVAAAAREDAPAPRRGHLENRSNLEPPGQVKNPGSDKAMTLVGIRGTKVRRRVELDELVLRDIAKVTGLTKPGHGLGHRVVRVELNLFCVTTLERDCKSIVTRSAVGLRNGNPGERAGRSKCCG